MLHIVCSQIVCSMFTMLYALFKPLNQLQEGMCSPYHTCQLQQCSPCVPKVSCKPTYHGQISSAENCWLPQPHVSHLCPRTVHRESHRNDQPTARKITTNSLSAALFKQDITKGKGKGTYSC